MPWAAKSAASKPNPDPVLILDTDHLTELGYATRPGKRLVERLGRSSAAVAITIVSAEEQLRGWLARIAKAKTIEEQVLAYEALGERMTFFASFTLLPWDRGAAARFERFRKHGVRVGTMDLRIACIVIEHDAVLLTRNTMDFEKVPGLKFKNWLTS
jgi:tRNA(fMet)-specific endonuclease VapC